MMGVGDGTQVVMKTNVDIQPSNNPRNPLAYWTTVAHAIFGGHVQSRCLK